MAQIIEISASEGLTSLTAKAYADGSDDLAATASAAVYATNRKGLVNMTFTALAVGVYRFELLDSVGVASVRYVYIDAEEGTWTEYEESSGDAQQATLLLVKAKTDLLGTGSVTVNSPVASDGTIPKIYQGDDYAGGRAISFTFNSGGFTIASSTSRFEAQPVEGNSFGADGTVTDNGNGTATLSIPISSAQSQLLQTGPVHWSALVITSSGGRQTVTSGKSPLETRKHE